MNKILPILSFSFVVITACDYNGNKPDDLYFVTKIIRIQDTIKINKPFNFKLVLRNDSLNKMKFTIDKVVQKSLSFNLDFNCGNDLLVADVPNEYSDVHDYQVYYLSHNDSLVYSLTAILSNKNDTLRLLITSYDRVYKLKNPKCKAFNVDIFGMWNPGEPYSADSYVGYGFGKRRIVIE